MTPAETIRTARLSRNMSQAALAQAAELSDRTVKRAESGHPISPETAQSLAAVLDLPPGSLVRSGGAQRAMPIVETTMTPDALALDGRRHALAAILEAGSGSHVIVPDPALLRSETRWTAIAERRNRRFELLTFLGLGCVLIAFLLIFVLPTHLSWVAYGSTSLGMAAMVVGSVFGEWKSSALYEARRRFGFAERSLIVVDGDTLHIVGTQDGATTRNAYGVGGNVSWTMVREGPLATHTLSMDRGPGVVMAGVPARSALDRFAHLAPAPA